MHSFCVTHQIVGGYYFLKAVHFQKGKMYKNEALNIGHHVIEDVSCTMGRPGSEGKYLDVFDSYSNGKNYEPMLQAQQLSHTILNTQIGIHLDPHFVHHETN